MRPRREAVVRLRASSAEAARWTAAADAAGHPSLSSWVRALADEAAGTGGTGREVVAALVALRQDLARGLGNNLNQLARHANEGHGVDAQAIKQAARDVHGAGLAIGRALRAVRPPRTPPP